MYDVYMCACMHAFKCAWFPDVAMLMFRLWCRVYFAAVDSARLQKRRERAGIPSLAKVSGWCDEPTQAPGLARSRTDTTILSVCVSVCVGLCTFEYACLHVRMHVYVCMYVCV